MTVRNYDSYSREQLIAEIEDWREREERSRYTYNLSLWLENDEYTFDEVLKAAVETTDTQTFKERVEDIVGITYFDEEQEEHTSNIVTECFRREWSTVDWYELLHRYQQTAEELGIIPESDDDEEECE